MIILTDKKLVIPVGIAPNYAGAGNSDIKLQSKSVTITENGSKTLFPDGNYDGFSQVNIKTKVASVNPVLEDKSVEISENGDYRFTPGPAYDGIGNFRLKVNVETYDPIPVESVKTAYPSFENDVTVVPSEGFEAMSSVIVKKAEPNLQDKTVDKASTEQIVLRADEGYQGLGTVTVAPIKTTSVTVDSSTNSQEVNANTENNEYITSVTVNPVKTKSLSITPRIVEQIFTAEQQLYKSVTVNPVTSSIDPNIIPENILKGVSILGVQGTVDVVSENENFTDLVNSIGSAITVKMKVTNIYREKYSDSEITVQGTPNVKPEQFTSNKDVPGYIRFFSRVNNIGSLADRGIIAYAVNGELHRVTDPNDMFIPYTKKSDEEDDVTVDVYIDFEQSGKWSANMEGEDYVTSSLYGPSYYYLPATFSFEGYLYANCNVYEVIVRNSVNAIGYYALFNTFFGEYGTLILEPSVDGIKRFSKNSLYRSKNTFKGSYIYGNVEQSVIITQNSESLVSDYFEVYGNISSYPPGVLTNLNHINEKIHGTITTSDGSRLLLWKYTDDTVDFYELCDRNTNKINDLNKRVYIPSTCVNVFLNYGYGNYGKYAYNKENEEIIFFSKTPPTLYAASGGNNNYQKLSINDPSTNNSNLKRVFIPKGSNYDSILREAPFRPEVIEFTPVTDLSTITVAGYYGYTAPDGSHTLLNVATTSQAESDIETIATEINNL